MAPNFVARHQVHLPQARPRDRGLPGRSRRGQLLHRQPRRGHARQDDLLLRLRRLGAGAQGRRARTTASSSPPASASPTTGSSWRATSGPSSRATTTASSRTRPASSTRTSTRRSTTPTSWSTPTGPLSAERQHQFKFDGSYQFSGALDGLNVGSQHLVLLGPAAQRLRLLGRLRELGVLPGAARLARPRTRATGRRTSTSSYPIKLGRQAARST